MNWLQNLVPPRFRTALRDGDTDSALWTRCEGCEQLQYLSEFRQALMVCSQCGHHARMDLSDRFTLLLDDGVYETVMMPPVPVDPLRFRDRKRYSERISDARRATERDDSVSVVMGSIGGIPAVLAVMDFSFMGGSMGIAAGEAIVTGARLAFEHRRAFVVVTASGGARMQEGILSLMQMPRTVLAIGQLARAGLPYVVILSNPTTGGVSASFAMLGDVTFAEPGSVIGFAGQRVITETVREQLPAGFQRAEYLLEHGMIDAIVARGDLKAHVALTLDLLMRPYRVQSSGDTVLLEDGLSGDVPEGA